MNCRRESRHGTVDVANASSKNRKNMNERLRDSITNCCDVPNHNCAMKILKKYIQSKLSNKQGSIHISRQIFR